MAVRNGKKVLPIAGGLRLRSVSALKDAVLFFDAVNTAPATTTGIYSLYTNGTSLFFNNGSSVLTVGGGGGGTPAWETIFATDATFTITPDTTFTIAGNRNTATNVVTMTNLAGASGAILAFTNSTATNNDILGTASSWAVTGQGAATFLTITLTGTTITSTGADLAWAVEDNDATALSIGAAGITNMLVFDTRTGVEVVSVSAGGFAVVNGAATFASASNTVVPVAVTNNTMTTLGAAANGAGALVVQSTSITTGSLLQLNLSDTQNAGGFYLNCRETIGGTNDFTIGENGVVVMAGTASTTSFTMSLGNLVLTDGTLSVTTTGTADVVAINSGVGLLTNNALIVSGAGVHTGVTTGSYVYIAPSGLTTGTALSVTAVGATTSVAVVDIQTLGLTSGTSLRIANTTATFTTGGKSLEIDHVAAVAGNGVTVTTTGIYTGTGLMVLSAGAFTTGIAGLSIVNTGTAAATTGSQIRTSINGTATLATNGVISFRHTGAYVSTADTGLLDVQASGLVGTGTVVNIKCTNGSQLTNTALNIEQTTTGAGYTGDFVKIVGTSTTGDCNLIAVTSASTTAGDALSITNNGITNGTATLVNLVHGTSVLGAGSSMLRITSTGTDTGTTTGVLLDLAATAATSATLVLMTSATLDSGKGVSMVVNGLTTGEAFHISHTTSVIADGGSLMRLQSTSIDTGGATNGTVLDLIGSGQLAGVGVLETFNAMTTGTVHRIVANAITTGTLLDLESSDALMNGLYFRCYDGAAVDFSVGVNGRLVIAGAAGITAVTVTAGDITTADGAIASAIENVTCGVGAATFAVDSNYVRLTGDAGGNTITTITGAVAGQILVLEFQDALVTIANDNTHGADSIDLLAGNTTFADDATLTLVYNGTSFYEVGRSINA